MTNMMTRGEAERLFGLTSDYTLAELKSSYKRYMVKFHPDKFPETPSDGKMGKAEAEKEFIKGGHAFEVLSPLFAGMPDDHKETPEANRRSQPASDREPAGHGADAHANATTNAYANGYADRGSASETGSSAGDAGTNAGSGFYGTSAREAWNNVRAERARREGGSSGTGGGNRGHASQGKKTSPSGAATATGGAAYGQTAPQQRTGTSVTDGSPVDTTNYATVHGGPLFWCIIVFGVLAILFWNQMDPKTAFVSVVQFIFNPGKMLLLLVGLGFVYIKGW